MLAHRRQSLGTLPTNTSNPYSDKKRAAEKGRASLGEYYSRYQEEPSSPPAARVQARAQMVAPRTRKSSFGDNVTAELNGVMGPRSGKKPTAAPQQMGRGVAQMNAPIEQQGRTSMVVVDRRPPATPQLMREWIRRVVAFFAARGYQKELSEKALESPTNALFKEVFVALVSLVDPATADDIAAVKKGRNGGGAAESWETMVVAFFRAIKYPVILSPKQLTAVAAPNTWPKYLSALIWLIDLVETAENVMDTLLQADPMRTKRFDFLAAAYASYMDGNDGAFDKVLAQLREEVDVEARDVRKRLEDIRGREAKLEGELESLLATGDAAHMDNLRDQLGMLEADKTKLAGIVAQWERKKEATASKLSRAREERARLEQELRDARDAQNKLAAQVKAQNISAAQVQHISEQRQRLGKQSEQLNKDVAETRARLWQLQADLDSERDALGKKVAEVNARTARLAPGAALVLDNASVTAEAAAQVKQALLRARDEFMVRAHRAREGALELADLEARHVDECREVEHRIGDTRRAVQRLDEAHAAETETHAREMDALAKELAAARKGNAMGGASGALAMLKDDEEEVAALRAELEGLKAEHAREAVETDETIHATLNLIIEFKETVEGVVEASSQRLQQVKAKVDAQGRAHRQAVAERVKKLPVV